MKKLVLLIAVILTVSTLLASCASNSSSTPTVTSSVTANSTTTTGKITKIVVGTGTQFPNVCFIDANGKLTGYDVEVLREIGKHLRIDVQFQTMDFSNLLLSLDTGKIDVVSHQMEKNPDREAKYLFNSEPYNVFPVKVTVLQNNTTINSIDDLKGKTVIVGATSNEQYLIDQYNAAHNNAIKVVYTGNGGTNDVITQLKSGRVDATLSTQFAVDLLNQAYDAQEKTVGPALSNSDTYYILRKDETALAAVLDQGVRALEADGTLSKLSIQWFGQDYTKQITK
jgi:L-cystine transport system substrate-binding protein